MPGSIVGPFFGAAALLFDFVALLWHWRGNDDTAVNWFVFAVIAAKLCDGIMPK